MLNKGDGKWFCKNLKPINSGMGFKEQQSLYLDQRSSLEVKAKPYMAEQVNQTKLLIIYNISVQHY